MRIIVRKEKDLMELNKKVKITLKGLQCIINMSLSEKDLIHTSDTSDLILINEKISEIFNQINNPKRVKNKDWIDFKRRSPKIIGEIDTLSNWVI